MNHLPEIHITSETPIDPAIHAWEYFLLDQGRSQHTIKAFVGDLNLFTRFFPQSITVGAITTDDINRFLEWLQNGRSIPCSPKSLSRRITSVKSFFRWLAQSGRISIDPAEKVLQKSVVSPLPSVLTPEEEEKVVEAAMKLRIADKPDARSYALISLLLSTGIKKSECLGININHIDLDNIRGPRVNIRYSASGSRYKERNIALNNDWIESYREYLEQYKPVEQLFPWSPRRLEYLLEDLSQAAGISKHLSFDMCRWTCALNDWRAGIEKETIRQKLGISKIQWREIGLKLRQLAGD